MARRGPKTKYTEEFLRLCDEYMDSYQENGQPVPTIEGLALHCNVRRETLYAWDRDPEKTEISNTLDELRTEQKLKLLSGGIMGDFNAAITKLTLSCNHDMHERTDSHVSGSLGLADLTDEELARRAAALISEGTGG
jgi:hypothetical protein